MAINKKLIHFKNKTKFDEELAKNNINDASICFIKDTQQIWTHGQLYSCNVDISTLENVVRVDEEGYIDSSIIADGTITRSQLGVDVIGENTVVTADWAHAEGRNTTASGQAAHAEGLNTESSNGATHAEGYNTKATNTAAHAEGHSTVASGSVSHAEGKSTTASGQHSHAEGRNTTASGVISHAEGGNTTASSDCAHAEGAYTNASAHYSHAEGYTTNAKGQASHTEGLSTETLGNASHAEGYGSIAGAFGSHAEGGYLLEGGTGAVGGHTKGMASHAEGIGTITSNIAEHASGKYNVSTKDETLFSVGNGTSDTDRHNAFEIKSDNTAYINNKRIVTEDTPHVITTTYTELKTLRDNAHLVPGALYRITDYETKLSEYTEGTHSGGEVFDHVLWGTGNSIQVNMDLTLKNYYFDIVVVALSSNEISEQAYAVHSARDVEGHFTNRNLSAWKVYYRLENKHDFWMIPKSAKGVIYKLINEYGNEAPYDFENVYYDNIPVFGTNCTNNILEGYYITLGSNCHDNYIGKNSVRIKIGNNSSGNTFGVECRGIVLGSYCNYNTFGNNCEYRYDAEYGTFGGGFWITQSTPRNYCSYNTFANGCAPHLECSASANAYSKLQRLCILTNSYDYQIEDGSGGGGPEWITSASISLPINIINSKSEIRVGTNSQGEIRIYRLEDLIN